MTLQRAVDFQSRDSFFLSLGRQLIGSHQVPESISIKNATDFISVLDKPEIFGGKKVVLIMDEFDRLYSAVKPEVVADIFQTLRSLRTNPPRGLQVSKLILSILIYLKLSIYLSILVDLSILIGRSIYLSIYFNLSNLSIYPSYLSTIYQLFVLSILF